MPLDSRDLDLTSVFEASKAEACSQFAADGRLLAQCGASGLSEQAQKSFETWRALCAFDDASFVVLSGKDRVSVVSAKGGLVFESRKPLNVGLLRLLTRAMSPVALNWTSTIDHSGFKPEQALRWALATRLGRVEAPRLVEMMAGEQEYVLQADKDGFDIIDQNGGVERLIEKLAFAVQNNERVEYTLGDYAGIKGSSRHHVNALLAAEGDGRFAANGWPEALPHTGPYEQTLALVQAAQTCWRDGLERIELRDAVGQPILSSEADPSTQTTYIKV